MALILSLLLILVTSLTGTLTWQRSVNNLRTTHSYSSQIRAQLLAESGIQISTLTPNSLIVSRDCKLTVTTVYPLVTSTAQCGAALSTMHATIVNHVVDGSNLPAHCTDGRGADNTHNPHCQPGMSVTDLLAVRYE